MRLNAPPNSCALRSVRNRRSRSTQRSNRYVQFLEETPDIPNDLIRAVTNGAATFLCGAGVSFRCNLPSFEALTTGVFGKLGETADNDPAEREAIRRREYDRALRSLEKRTHRPGTPSKLRGAVSELLIAPDGPFPDHLSLLQLSRDREGRPRLLTTNFDTLFERAARDAGMNVSSSAGSSMPRAGSERDHGILHLHGRIGDDQLGLSETELILTSSDFGDAYLRGGWASRYIEDRMRLGILVLVGYAAEDTAMRLLLETLDADRSRFSDLRPIYAIERGSAGSASLWKAKGITPIEFPDYDTIYRTLSEWARYAVQPVDYRRNRIETILGTVDVRS